MYQSLKSSNTQKERLETTVEVLPGRVRGEGWRRGGGAEGGGVGGEVIELHGYRFIFA